MTKQGGQPEAVVVAQVRSQGGWDGAMLELPGWLASGQVRLTSLEKVCCPEGAKEGLDVTGRWRVRYWKAGFFGGRFFRNVVFQV